MMSGAAADRESRQTGGDLVRVYVWELPVRLAHWTVFFAVLVLSVTGYYLYRPFVIARGGAAWVMGTTRFVHELAGFALICALIVRFYWYGAGNSWSRWTRLVPTTRERREGLREVLKYYAFLRWCIPPYIDHNPLAGLAYAGIYLVLIAECLTGLALLYFITRSRALGWTVGWIAASFDILRVRELHFLLMFVVWLFVVHHVYSAILVDVEEKMGILGSIFSGYKFVPRWLWKGAGDAAARDR